MSILYSCKFFRGQEKSKIVIFFLNENWSKVVTYSWNSTKTSGELSPLMPWKLLHHTSPKSLTKRLELLLKLIRHFTLGNSPTRPSWLTSLRLPTCCVLAFTVLNKTTVTSVSWRFHMNWFADKNLLSNAQPHKLWLAEAVKKDTKACWETAVKWDTQACSETAVSWEVSLLCTSASTPGIELLMESSRKLAKVAIPSLHSTVQTI